MSRKPAVANNDPLETYRAKRDFAKTPEPSSGAEAPEPSGSSTKRGKALSFVIQKHAATRLHYDFRLELDGVLVSWAVPKGPCFDPNEKRMAIRTEDHPLSYATFEGTIPPKQYGAGTVIVWDRGTWQPVGDAHAGLEVGKLVFTLDGEKLAGTWELVRIKKPDERQEPWILFKKRDAWARPLAEYDVITALPDSVNAKPLGRLAERETRATVPARPGARSAGGEGSAAPSDRVDGLPAAARKAPLPERLVPQLATLSEKVPNSGVWSYEIKFDGYRLLARIDHGEVVLYTRKGNDWTSKMQSLAAAVASLRIDEAWLDGEIVVMGADGIPNFNALQNAFDGKKTESIVYYLFDAPYFGGRDLRALPLQARREFVRRFVDAKGNDRIRFSEDFPADASSVLQSACEMGLEGIIAKRLDAPYESERSLAWLKLKCKRRQEFVIGGYTDRTGSTVEIGSLLLGVHDEQGRLVSAGNVGAGWNSEEARRLKARLAPLERKTSPFAPEGAPQKGRWSRRGVGAERWVEPVLLAEVSFSDWTPDGHIRHALYVALRDDKPAEAITREKAVVVPNGSTSRDGAKGAARVAAPPRPIRVSNPDRVIDASTGLKKLDLVRYYESVADRILPHLQGRPVSLVRGPQGVGGELFFQKHGEKIGIPGIRELDPKLWPGHDALLEIANVEALVGAAQLNVIELHTWNSTAKKIDLPDRMVFDLDPGEGVQWPRVQEAAVLTRTLLDELGLKSWLKTSGGKGLHVVVPIAAKLDYDTVKDFSQAVVQHLAKTIPSRFVAKSGASNRVGKIFVDYLRNGFGATTACAFSARARPGLGVSMPVPWEQLSALKGGAQWTIATAREHLSFETQDPWADYWTTKQALGRAMRILGFDAKRSVASR